MVKQGKEFFPDGTLIDNQFYQTEIPALGSLGKPYVITDYDVSDDGKIYTKQLQKLIDLIAQEGGGVLVVPAGTYYTGALFFKQGVHLYVSENGMLKGSDDISDYPVCDTRIEGECCKYYPALINADGIDGFTLCGKGTIEELRTTSEFVRITNASLIESHPHDISISKEAPNYTQH